MVVVVVVVVVNVRLSFGSQWCYREGHKKKELIK